MPDLITQVRLAKDRAGQKFHELYGEAQKLAEEYQEYQQTLQRDMQDKQNAMQKAAAATDQAYREFRAAMDQLAMVEQKGYNVAGIKRDFRVAGDGPTVDGTVDGNGE